MCHAKPIFQFSHKDERPGISYRQFQKFYTSVLAHYRDQGRVLFAFLLGHRDSHVLDEIFSNDAQYEAIHRMSGDRLEVFAFLAPPPVTRSGHTMVMRGTTAVYTDPNSEDIHNFTKSFQEKERLPASPALLFVQWEQGEEELSIGDPIPLHPTDAQQAFERLRTSLIIARQTLEKDISTENLSNYPEILDVIEAQVGGNWAREELGKLLTHIVKLKRMASGFGLFSLLDLMFK